MNLTLPKPILLSALRRVQPITSRRATTPELSCIRFAATDGCLSFHATDCETWLDITTDIPARDIDVLLPARRLLDKIDAMNGDDITMTCEKSVVRFQSGKQVFTLPPMPGALQRPVTGVGEGIGFAVETATLQRLLPFMSKEEARPKMKGIMAKEKALVACDGRHMLVLDFPEGESADALIPDTLIQTVVGLKEPALTVSLSETTATFIGKGITLTGLLSAEATGNWKGAMPRGTAKETATVNRLALLSAVAFVAAGATKYDTVRLTCKDGKIQVQDTDKESLEPACEEVEADVSGEMEIGVSGPYLMDAMRAFPDMEKVVLNFISPIDPLFIEHDGATAVIMPMRLA